MLPRSLLPPHTAVCQTGKAAQSLPRADAAPVRKRSLRPPPSRPSWLRGINRRWRPSPMTAKKRNVLSGGASLTCGQTPYLEASVGPAGPAASTTASMRTGADMRQDHGGAGLGHLLADLASTAQTVWFVSEAATTRRVRMYPEKSCSCRTFATLRLIRGGK